MGRKDWGLYIAPRPTDHSCFDTTITSVLPDHPDDPDHSNGTLHDGSELAPRHRMWGESNCKFWAYNDSIYEESMDYRDNVDLVKFHMTRRAR